METYYDPMDLAKFPEIGEEAPELAKKFFEYYGSVFAEGALTEREKALIALAVAHAVQCPYCIDAYTRTCLEKGIEPRRNDRSGPCGLRHPRGRHPRSRRADAECGQEDLDVKGQLSCECRVAMKRERIPLTLHLFYND